MSWSKQLLRTLWLRDTNHLAPLAGRGRKPRPARISGEGQRLVREAPLTPTLSPQAGRGRSNPPPATAPGTRRYWEGRAASTAHRSRSSGGSASLLREHGARFLSAQHDELEQRR